MSKIGRKAINLGTAKVEIKGKSIQYTGQLESGTYMLPAELDVEVKDNFLHLKPSQEGIKKKDVSRIWGLHRALFASKIAGAQKLFEKELEITGLGFKAVAAGSKLVLTLGFSHKIDFELPPQVKVDIDKTGQKLLFKSTDKMLVGQVCGQIKALRPPEPYKGTGIKLAGENIIRKAGKTKA